MIIIMYLFLSQIKVPTPIKQLFIYALSICTEEILFEYPFSIVLLTVCTHLVTDEENGPLKRLVCEERQYAYTQGKGLHSKADPFFDYLVARRPGYGICERGLI